MTTGTDATKNGTSVNNTKEDEDKAPPIKLTIKMDKRIDLACMVAVVLFGVFVLINTARIKTGIIPDPLTSRGMPYLTGIFLVCMAVSLIVMRLLTWSALPGKLVPSEGDEDEEDYPSSAVHAFVIIGACWLSTALFSSLGYLIATPLFLFICLWFLGTRSWVKLIGFPILFTGAVWYVFSQILLIRVPLGFIEPLFRQWGIIL
jgi:hypothetical protein